MKDLLLFPYNGNAREAVSLLEESTQWKLIGFITDDKTKWGKKFREIEVFETHPFLEKHPEAGVLAVPGRAENHLKRKEFIDALSLPFERFATLIHPRATLSKDTHVGVNTLIMAGVVTTANVRIGNHCIILPNTVLSHDVEVGDYCIIGSNVSISGSVHIKPHCYIGSGSKIIQEIEIGEGTLVGLGSIVIHSTEPYTVVAGNPAKFLRRNV